MLPLAHRLRADSSWIPETRVKVGRRRTWPIRAMFKENEGKNSTHPGALCEDLCCAYRRRQDHASAGSVCMCYYVGHATCRSTQFSIAFAHLNLFCVLSISCLLFWVLVCATYSTYRPEWNILCMPRDRVA